MRYEEEKELSHVNIYITLKYKVSLVKCVYISRIFLESFLKKNCALAGYIIQY